MSKQLRMLSQVNVGGQFSMSENEQVYCLMAIVHKGEYSMRDFFVCVNANPSAAFSRPFVVEGDRPVIVFE